MIGKKYLLCLLIVSVMFSGGCAGAADYDIDLPGDYSVLRTSTHEVTIAPKISETGWGVNVVPAEVTEVGWNDEYIIAKQVKGEKNHSFWIIQIDNGKITGPLNNSDFIEKKEEYGITNDIKLKKVQELKNN